MNWSLSLYQIFLDLGIPTYERTDIDMRIVFVFEAVEGQSRVLTIVLCSVGGCVFVVIIFTIGLYLFRRHYLSRFRIELYSYFTKYVQELDNNLNY
jgi:hypothetical protein